jgi:hypothetical protein
MVVKQLNLYRSIPKKRDVYGGTVGKPVLVVASEIFWWLTRF